jgi:hypothetical protein
MKKIRPIWIDAVIVGIFFIFLLFIQTRTIGKFVYLPSDEGVYLYASKLIIHGFIPYKDFFLAHMPFLMYANAALLSAVRFNLNIYHWIYTIWVLSMVFPVYLVTKKLTNNRLAAFLSVLLLFSFVELAKWGVHIFAIRQASLPFLAWAIFFLTNKKNLALAAFFLALFAVCLMTNLLLSAALIVSYLVFQFIYERKSFSFKRLLWPLLIFAFVVGSQLAFIFLLPNGYKDVIGFQITRSAVDMHMRLSMIGADFAEDWPLLLFGLLGVFVFKKETAFLSVFNALAIIIVISTGNSFYVDYLSVLAVSLAISAGVLFGVVFSLNRLVIWPALAIVLLGVYFSDFKFLQFEVMENKSQDFFAAVNVIKNIPEPIFSDEPLFAIYSNKNLTFHYHVADMRYYSETYENISTAEYLKLLSESGSVLLNRNLKSLLPREPAEYISQHFDEVYFNGVVGIYIKHTPQPTL